MKSVRFHDSKLKLVKALLFRSFHETEAPTAGFVQRLIVEGRIHSLGEEPLKITKETPRDKFLMRFLKTMQEKATIDLSTLSRQYNKPHPFIKASDCN